MVEPGVVARDALATSGMLGSAVRSDPAGVGRVYQCWILPRRPRRCGAGAGSARTGSGRSSGRLSGSRFSAYRSGFSRAKLRRWLRRRRVRSRCLARSSPRWCRCWANSACAPRLADLRQHRSQRCFDELEALRGDERPEQRCPRIPVLGAWRCGPKAPPPRGRLRPRPTDRREQRPSRSRSPALLPEHPRALAG